MKNSESIANLSPALTAAQAEMPVVAFDSTNPFLHNRYASLGAVIEASRPILKAHGLAVTQLPFNEGDAIGVETTLIHTSGEWVSERLAIPLGEEKGKSRAQVAGSIITYLRRYAWASMLGLYADEDTDGNAPQGAPQSRQNAPRQAGSSERPKTPPAPAKPPPASGASATPPAKKKATAETRTWMIQQIGKDLEQMATEYFWAVSAIMPNENLDNVPLRFVPTCKADMAKLKDAIVDFGNGEPATELPYPVDRENLPGKAPAPAAAPAPADGEPPGDDGQGDPNDPDSPNAKWRSHPVPFGKSAGVALADLPKNSLFGFWANFAVETEYNGKPRSADKISADQAFRAMLDEAGKHYKFKTPEDKAK